MGEEELTIREDTVPLSQTTVVAEAVTRHRWYPLIVRALEKPGVWLSGAFLGDGHSLRQLASARKSILEMAQQAVILHNLTGEIMVTTERDMYGVAWVYVCFTPAEISESVSQ